MSATPGIALTRSGQGATALRYAQALLRDLGQDAVAITPMESPALAAARCGLLALTGPGGEAPRMPPAPLASCAQGALAALQALPGGAALSGMDGAALLGERAACDGLSRAGTISPGGACRILPCADGWLAVQLARPDDWAMLPAWLEDEVLTGWDDVAEALRGRETRALSDRAALLGLAVSECAAPREGRRWCERVASGPPRATSADRSPLVLDLSSLWAGPLCSHLLQTMGARVIKLESLQRPDGARAGNTAFFDLLNAGKACVALDFTTHDGRAQLRALIARADIVIESARPRALWQLGIDAEACVAQQPGLSWISITGYGRSGAAAMRTAYGDDAAAGAGLAWMMAAAHGEPGFVGDAVADPLTGMHAALCAWAAWCSGVGGVWSLSLCDVVTHCINAGGSVTPTALRARVRAWQSELAASGFTAQYPQARAPAGHAAALGADTQRVLSEAPVPC